jgi:hypothetical protein
MAQLPALSLSAALISLTLAAPGCKKKNPENCTNAKNVIQQALTSEDFASARQWRDYAYKQCDSADMQALDQQIVTKEGEVQKRKADEDALKRRTDDLVKLFSDWVAQHRAAPSGAAVTVNCGESSDPKDPKKEKERWCNRERAAGEFKLRVSYWDAEPDAFEFSTTAPGPVACTDLGPGSVLKTNHSGALLHCNITGGTLTGTQALIVRTAQGTQISVVTPKYVEKNEAFRRRLSM